MTSAKAICEFDPFQSSACRQSHDDASIEGPQYDTSQTSTAHPAVGARRPRPGLMMAFMSPARFGDTLRDARDPKLRRQG